MQLALSLALSWFLIISQRKRTKSIFYWIPRWCIILSVSTFLYGVLIRIDKKENVDCWASIHQCSGLSPLEIMSVLFEARLHILTQAPLSTNPGFQWYTTSCIINIREEQKSIMSTFKSQLWLLLWKNFVIRKRQLVSFMLMSYLWT